MLIARFIPLLIICLLVGCAKHASAPKQVETSGPSDEVPFPLEDYPVYSSTDYGKSWEPAGMDLPIEVQGSFLEAKGGKIVMGTDGQGLFLSDPDIGTWRQIGTGLPEKKINALHVSGDSILVGLYQNGIWLSTDEGKTWKDLNSNIIHLNVNAILTVGESLFAGTDIGIFKSQAEKLDWKWVHEQDQIVSLQETSQGLIAGSTQGVLMSSNAGDSWEQKDNGGALHNTAYQSGKIFCLYIFGELRISSDHGENFRTIPYDPHLASYIYELIQIDDHFLFTNNYGVHSSIDGGESWDLVFPNESNIFMDFLVKNGFVYACRRNRNEFRD
ncbi:MAG: hypothetical protein HKN16_13845 [Saprospiraceae bacterium]|nr:hypothetical protein [Saprospiraceae bacterium]